MSITRPGISNAYLTENSIREVFPTEAETLCGCRVRGIYIPYYDPILEPRTEIVDKNKAFGRLRKTLVAKGNKYHQEAGTCVHAYAPSKWRGNGSDTIAIVEGEFKALSLTDSANGYVVPAVGIGGFFGGTRRTAEDSDEFELTPELRDALETFQAKQILFIGDNDTVLNPHFAIAAVRMAKLLPDLEVLVVQIPLDKPKGVDDCREEMGKKFETFFEELVESAPVISGDTDPDEFTVQRLAASAETLKSQCQTPGKGVYEKLIRLAAQVRDGHRQELMLIVKSLKVGTTEFRKAVEKKQREIQQESAAKQDEKTRRKIEGFYCAGKTYWRRKESGEFVELHQRADVLLHLVQDARLSRPEAERALLLIQKEQRVDYAGPLAGFPPGIVMQNAKTVLSTTGPNIIESKYGDWSFLAALLQEFFGKVAGDPEWQKQYKVFCAYLSRAYKAVRNPDVHLPGQMLGLVGPVGIGKTLIAEHVLTPLYGGRQADLSDYLTGGKFNSALLGAEHLLASDAAIPNDDDKRQIVRSRIKQSVANETQPVYRKFGEQLDLRVVRRITILANGDAHGLSIFPEPDESMRDKMIVLKCYRPTALPEDDRRKDFLSRLRAGLSAFSGFLSMNRTDEPLADDRFGVGHYIHPDINCKLKGGDPVKTLASFLDHYGKPLIGSAGECYTVLQQQFRSEFADKVTSPSELGRMLFCLKAEVPGWKDRIEKDQKTRPSIWTINPAP